MNKKLAKFISAYYRQTVMGDAAAQPWALFEEFKADPEFVAAARSRRAEIAKMAAFCDLSKRDFPSYKSGQAIDSALARLEGSDAAG